MSEEILEQLVKMVAANNRQQAEMKDMMTEMKDRMVKMDDRMDKMDDRMDKMNDRMDKMNDRMDKMNDRMDKMNDRMEMMDKRFAVIEHDTGDIKTYMYRIERLERQLDKTISQVSRLAVDVEMLQQDNN